MSTPASVPPIPYKSPMLDKGGFLTPAWSKWFQFMFNRIGGLIAPSNTDLSTTTSTLQTSVSALQTSTASASSLASVQSSVNDINQGRTL